MAEWPDLDELKQAVNVVEDDWDTTLGRIRTAAIRKVKSDVGHWDEDTDAPSESLAQAALRMAELIADRPAAVEGRVDDPTYQRLLSGHRRRFGIG